MTSLDMMKVCHTVEDSTAAVMKTGKPSLINCHSVPADVMKPKPRQYFYSSAVHSRPPRRL